MDAQGFKKPSSGFILDPDQALTALKNAQIEVRARTVVFGTLETREPDAHSRRFVSSRVASRVDKTRCA